jgi:hypothetical protein
MCVAEIRAALCVFLSSVAPVIMPDVPVIKTPAPVSNPADTASLYCLLQHGDVVYQHVNGVKHQHHKSECLPQPSIHIGLTWQKTRDVLSKVQSHNPTLLVTDTDGGRKYARETP